MNEATKRFSISDEANKDLQAYRLVRDGMTFEHKMALASARAEISRLTSRPERGSSAISTVEKRSREEHAAAVERLKQRAKNRSRIRMLAHRAFEPRYAHERPEPVSYPPTPPGIRVLELTAHNGSTGGFVTQNGELPWKPIVDRGVWGWAGETLDLQFMNVPLDAMTHSNVAGGSLVGSAVLGWNSVKIPTTGSWRFDFSGHVLLWGNTTVQGEGWALSDDDAMAEVNLEFWAMLDDDAVFSDLNVIKHDATKSEERTKHFRRTVALPGDLHIDAEAGQTFDVFVRIMCPTWANNEGAAKVGIYLFGIESNVLADVTRKLYD